jgi:hypothetical protein
MACERRFEGRNRNISRKNRKSLLEGNDSRNALVTGSDVKFAWVAMASVFLAADFSSLGSQTHDEFKNGFAVATKALVCPCSLSPLWKRGDKQVAALIADRYIDFLRPSPVLRLGLRPPP